MRLPLRHLRDVSKIGELAEELGTTPRTIHLYEVFGLIAPNRTTGGTRGTRGTGLYAKKDLKPMPIALRLGRMGISLEALQQLECGKARC